MIYKNRRTHRMRRLENRVAQLERMASAYTIVVATPEDADRLTEERINPRLMTPQEWANAPIPHLTAEDCRNLYPLGDAYGNQMENGWQDMADRLNRILAGKT